MQKTLTTYRREAGFNTQEELASLVGIARNTVSRWETGARYPRLPMIPILAKTLNITEGDVIAAVSAAKRTTN